VVFRGAKGHVLLAECTVDSERGSCTSLGLTATEDEVLPARELTDAHRFFARLLSAFGMVLGIEFRAFALAGYGFRGNRHLSEAR
jgi:hypothetical protein